jgi:cellulose synthase/poly-beta-1,6-N-acetylglucosamine synthase-like glycosyltransferase
MALPSIDIAADRAWSTETTSPPLNDNPDDPLTLACELDCVAGLIAPAVLRLAARRALQLGIGADRVLIAAGAISERDYLRHLADHCGFAIETFRNTARADVLLTDAQLGYAARTGLILLRDDAQSMMVITPQGLAARRLVETTRRDPSLAAKLRLACADDVQAFLLHRAGDALATEAAWGLAQADTAQSAAPRRDAQSLWQRVTQRLGQLVPAMPLLTVPLLGLSLGSQCVAAWFIAASGLRLYAASRSVAMPQPLARLRDSELPVYSIIIALYREARSVPSLLRALAALDYPREKLDILIVIEADDEDTAAALAADRAASDIRVLTAPRILPRTKPKALNCALAFARGGYIAVFDAEDRPDPGQLRAALDTFRRHDDDVACVQASLCIDNHNDSLITGMFAAEYAGQFDAVLPGLAAMGLPLPLGGTSNHFRAESLRAVGGWDAWNVTEDADLGLRLARQGWRSVMVASATQEEAPIRLMPWLKQRTRWMKGWMQCWAVHAREPVALVRDGGWRCLIALNLLFASHVVSALVYPLFALIVLIDMLDDEAGAIAGLLTPLHGAALAAGLLAACIVPLIGLSRRNRLRHGWIVVLTPIYWIMLSLATWRALWQFVRDPYRWEKTEHGLSRHPRDDAQSNAVGHSKRFSSAAASSGGRLMLKGEMNLPLRSIR